VEDDIREICAESIQCTIAGFKDEGEACEKGSRCILELSGLHLMGSKERGALDQNPWKQ